MHIFNTKNNRKKANTKLSILHLITPFLSGFLSTILVWITSSKFGLGYNPDGVTALATARNLLYHGIFHSHEMLYVLWPPLFPLLQAGGGMLGIDPSTVARIINAVSYGGMIGLATWVVTHICQTRLGIVLGTITTFLAFPTLRESIEAGTEPLFGLLILGFIVAAAQYLRQATHFQLWIIASLAALACLQRYAGITLVAAGGLMILGQITWKRSQWTSPSRQTWTHFIWFGLASLAPVGLWLTRNFFLTKTITGPRSEGDLRIGKSIYSFLESLTEWLIPVPFPLTYKLTLTILLIITLFFIIHLWKSKPRYKYLNYSHALIFCLSITVGAYALLIITTGAIRASDLPNRRLLMPIYLPTMLLVLIYADAAYERLRINAATVLRWVLALGHVIWIAGAGIVLSTYITVRADQGAGGYSTKAWQTSETASWVRQRSINPPIASNERHALYALTEKHLVSLKKTTTYRYSDIPQPPYTLVCFANLDRAQLDPRDIVRKITQLIPVAPSDLLPMPPKPSQQTATAADCSPLVHPRTKIDTLARLDDGAVYRIEDKKRMFGK